MRNFDRDEVIDKVKDTLIKASSTYSCDKQDSYKVALDKEDNDLAKWAIENIILNEEIARKDMRPLCDDTGIPHLILEMGKNRSLTGNFTEAVYEGVRRGLTELPGRPMAIKGDDSERIDQSGGLDERPDAVLPAPLLFKQAEDDNMLRLTILMQGGGPEIRAKTYRVFHKHSMDCVVNEIIEWACDAVPQLGCSPCTIAVGIGRSHFEASAMMLQAMQEGKYSLQSEYENNITESVNKIRVGALGLGGKNSVLATFMKIGPQRASGVRIVCMRPCCCFEPRRAWVEF